YSQIKNIFIESMSKINKLTTSFIKITNALEKVKNQDEYDIYVSMLDEEELECLKYVQRLRKYTNRQLSAASPNDTDESKAENKKRGRKNKVAGDDVVIIWGSNRQLPLSVFT
ncbi:MAG: hypothetical protein ACKO96_28800, partial [Flammeovirgaceae bacterium]